jgi:hypothetical protein
LEALLKISKDRPRRKDDLSLYSSLFYTTKLKDSFDAMWENGLRDTVPAKHRIHWCKKFTRERWLQETEEFRRRVEQQAETEYAEALEKWKNRVEWSGSPEEYQRLV